jgi:hypothetical protein
VGEDALDAQVSYLAALTGGEVFIATGASADTAIAAAFRALRGRHSIALPIAGKPVEAVEARAGMRLAASWSDAAPDIPALDSGANAAVAALAASLAIPRMPEEEAAALAESQGIVCHLTSLVLVDEEGAAQEGLPVQHKVPLMTPASASRARGGPMAGGAGMPAPMPASMAAPPRAAMGGAAIEFAHAAAPAGAPAPKTPHRIGALARLFGIGAPDGLASLKGRIDWNALVAPLSAGDLTGLDAKLADVIGQAAKTADIRRLARLWDVAPILVCIGLLGWAERNGNRTAARIFRLHLGAVDLGSVEEATRALRLA